MFTASGNPCIPPSVVLFRICMMAVFDFVAIVL
jgi:hypothetical protein